ncbi:hypothetical protein OAQ84_01875 [Bdellovibrionales bacterium]|nr:hypothetical protein [Bdellovibrionales bacterium]
MLKKIIIITIPALLFGFGTPSLALPQIKNQEMIRKLKSQGAGLTSKITFKKIQRVHTLLMSNRIDNAIKILKKLSNTTKSREFEQAQVLQLLGMVYAQKGSYKQAIKTLEMALSLNSLPYSLSLSSLYSLAQLSMGEGNSEMAEKWIKKWFLATSKPKPAAYILYAYTMVEQKRKKEALESVEFALSESGKKSASWLQLAAVLNLENKNYKRAIVHLKDLLTIEVGSKRYWKQLVAAYLNLNDYKNALASMELADKKGLIKEKGEILNLTSLLVQQGMPYWGAKLLEEAIKKKIVESSEKNLLTLAQCWMMAEEIDRAIGPMSLAVKMSKSGKTAARLGQLYMEKEDWRKAQKFLKLALAKGSLTSPERAHLALGIVHFSLLQNREAAKHFKISLKNDKTKRSAQQWLNHIKESTSS